MEVLQTERHFIFVKREKTLWWDRNTFEFTSKTGWDLSAVDDVECLGIVHGIIGLIHLRDVHEPQLLLIREFASVGILYIPYEVFKVRSIAVLGAGSGLDCDITPCTKHRSTTSESSPAAKPKRVFNTSPIMNKTWGAVKSGAKSAASIASSQIRGKSASKDGARIGKKLTEELHRIFDDSDSFYYCLEGDITNNLQRQGLECDTRFYWNQIMLQPILELEDPSVWVLPIMQGFIQIEVFAIENECYSLAIVSRRSRYRAGTRYKRRGVDSTGFVANYVETEQILTFKHHQLSFTQVRGSVPVYWSQPGYKYRPPPQIDKGEEETFAAFSAHFEREIDLYKSICVVNLVEQGGKEKIIADAYSKNIVKYNSDKIIYVTFDFHTYCRGMHFENVAILIDAIAQVAGGMGFTWRDAKGTICDQKGVFRVNCMDCLDRTNVVMTAIGRTILEMQLIKLGMLAGPNSMLPDEMKAPFMLLWANNGDVISRQYAGTDALKGDYTRTGERKVTGMLKDGMNSANRYYLARFKDAYRQATIDLMTGNEEVVAETLSAFGKPGTDEMDALEGAEHAKILVEDCRRLLVGQTNLPVGAWGLINADPSSGDLDETEVDTILLLTDNEYIVAEYDSELDKIVRFEEVPLADLSQIEVGLCQPTKLFTNSRAKFHCIRINYKVDGAEGFFHMFRSPNIRFFNNVAVVIRTEEEKRESLLSIIEFFRITLDSIGKTDVSFVAGEMLERKKNRTTLLEVPGAGANLPRNLSESQLVQASSKAITSVAGHFSKFSKGFKRGKDASDTAGKSLETSPRGSDDGHISDAEEILENVVIKDSEFLPSVGIVMSTGSESNDSNLLAEKDNAGTKPASDMSAFLYSSVANNISMPSEMLENEKTPIRPRSPQPQQQQQSQQHHSGGKGASIRQIKNLTVGKISKIAKGVQHISSNLDPRKINVGSRGKTTTALAAAPPSEPLEDYREKLYQLWIDSECQTKLVAL